MNAPAAQRPARAKYAEIGIQLPRGRFVLGSLTKLQTKDMRQQPLEERRHHWFTAYAIDKRTPGVVEAVNQVFQHAWNSYSAVAGAQAVLQQIGLGFRATAFAWGITDADLDPKWAARDGCKGCYIFKTRRNIAIGPIPTFDPNIVTLDPNAIGLGDYVDVFLVAAINGEVGGTAGMFLQPGGVRWLETGERIVPAGRSGAEMFGQPLGYGHTGAVVPPMNAQMMGQMGAPQAPGMAGPAPGYAPSAAHQPAPPPPPPAAPAPAVEPAETVAARHGVQHYPGYRFDPAIWNYVPDVTPNAPAAAPAAPAYAQQHQAAPSVAHGTPQATAYPGSPYGPGNPPPGVQPHTGFAGGPPRVG